MGSVLRRRWALILGLFALLSVLWMGIWVFQGGRPQYVAEARLAVRDPRGLVADRELAAYLSPDSSAHSFFTREGLLGAGNVYDVAAILLTRAGETEFSPMDWTAPSSPKVMALIKDVDYDPEKHGPWRARLNEAIRIVPAGDPSGVMRIQAVSADSGEAVRMANAFAWSGRGYVRAKSDELMAKIRVAFDPRLRALRGQVETKEFELRFLDEEMLDRDRRMQSLNAAMADLDRKSAESMAHKDRITFRLRALEAAEHRRREALPSGPADEELSSPVLKRLREDMDSIRITMAQEGLNRKPDAPRTRDFMRRLAELEGSHRIELDRVRAKTILDLRRGQDKLDDELALLDQRQLRNKFEFRQLAEAARTRNPLREELTALRDSLARAEGLEDKLEAADKAGSGFHVVFGAAATDAHVPPGPPRGALWPGFLVAALVALGVGCLAERGDLRIRTDADVKKALDLPSLAVVEEAGEPVILRLHPQDPLGETYAMAATMLRSYLGEREFKTCSVTSASAQEGKTTVAANLAVALARKGLQVVLVDADLRRPRLHEIFGTDNTHGLASHLMGEVENVDELFMSTELPGLRLLPSGTALEMPPELLDSSRMADLHASLREKADIVIFDAPPATEVGDGLALSRLVDTNVWVIRAGQTDRREASWARHLLGNVRADVAGVVLNFARRRGGERVYSFAAAAGRR